MKIHVCFDLDGTLIDSIELMEKSWNNAASILNIQCEFHEYKKYIGLPFDVIMEKLELSKIALSLNKLYFNFNKANIKSIKLNPDFEKLIFFLKKNKIDWSIITSKPKKNTEEILKHFKIKCKYVICPEDVARGKPYPDSISKLKEVAKLNKKRIIYVGDMMSDLQFAINSQVEYVHFSNGIEKSFSDKLVTNCKYIKNLYEISSIVK